jgi:primosomal protein N' (replication factor Y)
MPVLRLAIPSPLRQTFDYLPPAGFGAREAARLQPGIRLRVPFGSRQVTGYLLEVLARPAPDSPELREALEVLDREPLITPPIQALCRWAAGYYLHPPGEVYACALPVRLRRGGSLPASGEPGWQLTARGMGLPEGALARSPRQARALALLQADRAVAAAHLAGEGISPGVLRSLQTKGLIQRCTLAPAPRPGSSGAGLPLNGEQQRALDGLRRAGEGFSCHLLEGVTGSGKTEIYLQLIADVIGGGRQALVLIPEIGLTPQTLERFRQRFDARIVVLHSGLSAGDRCRAWEAARDGSAQIVIGTRSAVFTPLRRPGLIVVDEEHDTSYKQQDGFRYSARDVAVKRGQLERCRVVLGSATPSLESLRNALTGRYALHRLTARAGGASLPRIETLDVRRLELQSGLSAPLLDSIESTVAAGAQVLLFLNRRGYAPTLRCHDCGWIALCGDCDARLTLHRRQRRLRCHHCGGARPLPLRCPECHSARLLTRGLGTEQAEEFLRARFGSTPVFRVDSDSMSGRSAMHDLVSEINRGEPCVLVGTQMLAKGHHFPCVSLAAVMDADALLFSSDFRGEERLAQLLTQVAGRAGRAGLPGRVILQTHYPDHPAMQAMLQLSYHEQSLDMLRRRREAGMPPEGQLVLLRTDCADADWGEQFLRDLRRLAERALPRGAALVGPLPSPMPRRAGRFRSQLMLTAGDRRCAGQAATRLVACAETLPQRRGLKWSIDVDPQEIF